MLTGGGSGGHITPLLAVAKELKLLNQDIVCLGVCESGCKFGYLYQKSADIDRILQISAGKFRRYSADSLWQKLTDWRTNWLNFCDIFRTLVGFCQALKLLRRERPDVILIKGGFVSVPVGLASVVFGIPYITHDSDSVPGLANRLISKWARINATGMPTELYSYPEAKKQYVGIPLSADFVKVGKSERERYRRELSIDRKARVVTVVGGSQGGVSLNSAIVSVARELLTKYDNLHIVHIAGADNVADTETAYSKAVGAEMAERVHVYGFVDDVYRLQGAADVVIARAGATQTAELAVQGLPVILVPANLAGGHQLKNARYFESKGLAKVVASNDGELIKIALIELLDKTDLARVMADAFHDQSQADSASVLAELVLTEAKK